MQPLWAPWRMEYILGVKPQECILCEKPKAGPAHHLENLILVARPRAFVMMNRYPYTNGHLLVTPYPHVASPAALTAEDHGALWDLVRDSIEALRRALHPEGVNVGINLGLCAGAGIEDHLHVHIVPRWTGDTNFMSVIADVRVMPEYLRDTYARLLPEFAPLAAAPGGGGTAEPCR
jgi:ATP adenylyltransferase